MVHLSDDRLPFVLKQTQFLGIRLDDYSAFFPARRRLWPQILRFWRPETRRAVVTSLKSLSVNWLRHSDSRDEIARIVSLLPYLTTLRHLSLDLRKIPCPPVSEIDPDSSHLFRALWRQLSPILQTLALSGPLSHYNFLLDNAQSFPLLRSLELGMEHSPSTSDLIHINNLNSAIHSLATFIHAQQTHLENFSMHLYISNVPPPGWQVDLSEIFNLNELPALRSFEVQSSHPDKTHLGPALDSFLWRHSLNLRRISLYVTRFPNDSDRITTDNMAFTKLEVIRLNLWRMITQNCMEFMITLFHRASSTLKDVCVLHLPFEEHQFASILEALSRCQKLTRLQLTVDISALNVEFFDQLSAALPSLRDLVIHFSFRIGDETIPFEVAVSPSTMSLFL